MALRPRVLTTLRMTLRAVLVAAAVGGGVVAPAAASPAQDLDGVCARAAELTNGGHPQQALTLIAELRGTPAATRTPATPAADPHPTWCEGERLGALEAIGAARALVDYAAAVEAATGDPLTLGGVGACPRAADSKGLLRASGAGVTWTPADVPAITAFALDSAQACDADSPELAAALAAATEKSAAERAQESWRELFDRRLAPWQDIAVALLAWLFVGLALVRFAPFLLGNWGVPTKARREDWMAWLGGTALVLGACAGSLGAGISGDPTWWAMGAALLLAGVGVLSLWHRSTPSLTVDAPSGHEAVGAQLRALAFDMGGVKPRGLTLPVGLDTTFLTGISFPGVSDSVIAKAIGAVVNALTFDPPWRLAVTESTDDVLAVELRRNRQLVSAQRLDRESLRLTAADLRGTTPTAADGPTTSAATTPSLLPFAAALAVVSMAKAHGERRGLAGATHWRSVAVQYVATTSLRTAPSRRELLARAVALDPHNALAEYALWADRYAASEDATELGWFRTWLVGFIAQPRLGEELALLLRARYALVAAEVNLRYVEGGRPSPGALDHYRQLTRLLDECLADDGSPRYGGVGELARSAQGQVEAIGLSVGMPMAPAPDLVGLAPATHYTLACYFASAGPGHGPLPPNGVTRALRHLSLADVQPALTARRAVDPQLAALRATTEYRTAYGATPEQDLLTLKPFAGYATPLRALGLTDAAALAVTPTAELAALGIPTAVAGRLRLIAQTAAAVPPALASWRVPITAFLLDRAAVPLALPRPDLVDPMKTSLGTYSTVPDPADLGAFLAPPADQA